MPNFFVNAAADAFAPGYTPSIDWTGAALSRANTMGRPLALM
jgi:hypothetical protein